MSSVRDRVDRCPGALSVHAAADGGLARVRLPGGTIHRDALRTLAAASVELGDGHLELTSRGNIQLRALAAGAEVELAHRLADAGLLPSLTHERVRNIVASPLSGLDGHGNAGNAGNADIVELARSLDRQLCSRPALAGLPGRFLFAVDDGRGDVAALNADVALIAQSDSTLMLQPAGCRLPWPSAVAAALDLAEEFLLERARTGSAAWRISELEDGGAALRATMRLRLGTELESPLPPLGSTLSPTGSTRPGSTGPGSMPPPRPVGVHGHSTLVLLAPLGRLTSAQAGFIADQVITGDLRITPWRSVVLPHLDHAGDVAARAAELGLGTSADSPWYWVSACTGRPGCASALGDVQADAVAEVAAHADGPFGSVTRWSGCERRCGRPPDTELDIVATGNGYRRTPAGSEESRKGL